MSNATNNINQTNEIQRRIGPEEKLITLGKAVKYLPKVNGKKPANVSSFSNLFLIQVSAETLVKLGSIFKEQVLNKEGRNFCVEQVSNLVICGDYNQKHFLSFCHHPGLLSIAFF